MTTVVVKPSQQPNRFILGRPKYDRVEAQTRFLSKKARLMARGQDVLFHGTRHRESVLTSGFLQSSPYIQTVSFTRSPKVAAYWAALPRDDDEGSGAVLVFDRASLKARYKFECVDNGWEFDPSTHNEFWRADHDEFEEQVWARNVEIAPHLIGLISTPIPTLSHKSRAIKRAKELQLARDTADCGCGARWRTCTFCKAEKAEKKAEQLERAYPGISKLWREGKD
jgi:hypothetical protein